MTPERRDMLYMHQISTPKPEALDENAFFVVDVCDKERQSQRIHSALLKNGVLTTPEDLVDTYKDWSKIHTSALLHRPTQKNLINVLFWWEEETQRFWKLVEEEKELGTMISELETRPEETTDKETLDKLKFARERVRMKKRQRPSQ